MIPSSEPVVAFENVNKHFGPLHVLRDLTLTIERGEVVVICGPSGSGKSTLIRCINRLENFQSGKLSVLGKDLSDPKLNLAELRSRVGIVFQAFNLYPHMTVMGNILLAPMKVSGLARDAASERALKLLRRVDIPDKADSYPAQLSGGQQQRVAIARAIVNRPAILLADEPTGALDSRTSEEIMALFQSLNKDDGMTVIFVTHEKDIGHHTGRIIHIRDGAVQADERVMHPLVAADILRDLDRAAAEAEAAEEAAV